MIGLRWQPLVLVLVAFAAGVLCGGTHGLDHWLTWLSWLLMFIAGLLTQSNWLRGSQ